MTTTLRLDERKALNDVRPKSAKGWRTFARGLVGLRWISLIAGREPAPKDELTWISLSTDRKTEDPRRRIS